MAELEAETGEYTVTVAVNGRQQRLVVEGRTSLADALRERLGLTGLHLGCEQGACGACTVLLDGDAVRACLVLAVQVQRRSVTTIEGLGSPERLHPIQQAFRQAMSFQCGFCTPGFVMTVTAWLQERGGAHEDAGDLDEAEIREALGGNLCRCTGYESIVDGVRLAAGAIADPGGAPGRPGGDDGS